MALYEERNERIRKLFSFKIRDIEFQGSFKTILITDQEILEILNFKGTGDKRKFMDVIKEVYKMNWELMEEEFNSGNVTREHVKYSDYIRDNDIRLVFEDGDLKTRNYI